MKIAKFSLPVDCWLFAVRSSLFSLIYFNSLVNLKLLFLELILFRIRNSVSTLCIPWYTYCQRSYIQDSSKNRTLDAFEADGMHYNIINEFKLNWRAYHILLRSKHQTHTIFTKLSVRCTMFNVLQKLHHRLNDFEIK